MVSTPKHPLPPKRNTSDCGHIWLFKPSRRDKLSLERISVVTPFELCVLEHNYKTSGFVFLLSGLRGSIGGCIWGQGGQVCPYLFSVQLSTAGR